MKLESWISYALDRELTKAIVSRKHVNRVYKRMVAPIERIPF